MALLSMSVDIDAEKDQDVIDEESTIEEIEVITLDDTHSHHSEVLDEPAPDDDNEPQDTDDHSIPNFFLPKSIVRRIVRSSVGSNCRLTPEFLDGMGRASSVFVLYLFSIAQRIAKEEKKTTISAKHISDAMKSIGLSDILDN